MQVGNKYYLHKTENSFDIKSFKHILMIITSDVFLKTLWYTNILTELAIHIIMLR